MTRRWTWIVVALVLVVLAVMLAGGGASVGVSSSLSKAASGGLAWRQYLQVQQEEVHLVDQPLAQIPTQGTWVLSFPWSASLADSDLDAISDHLRAGGQVILAYSGTFENLAERLVCRELNLELEPLRAAVPLTPWSWWSYRREGWLLLPEDGVADADQVVEVGALEWAPVAPTEARVLYRDEAGGRPLIFEVQRQRGRVLVLPQKVLSNGRLLGADNAELLEVVRARLDGPWHFDEYHHGWQRLAVDSKAASSHSWDMFVLHLLAVYVLAILALVRRFGPAWRLQPVVSGSSTDFLRGVGALHHGLGHHRQAAEWMLKRARQVDPHVDWDDLDADAVSNVDDGAGLVALGREISRRQLRRRS